MATYSLAECLRMDFPRRFPRHLRRHIRPQSRQCLHRHRIVEGCAARWIAGSRRAQCAETVSLLRAFNRARLQTFL